MRNCLILGCGRSGTSMAAGVLARAGYFMGNTFHPPRDSNPKGFFEGPEINGINEELLSQVTASSENLQKGQRWLAKLPPGTPIPSSAAINACITWMVGKEPFCYKDPRFSYTLPIWRPHLRDTVFLCIFRHPAITVSSIVKECREAAYLHNVHMTEDRATEIWQMMYSHIMEIHRHEGDWLFLHYEQFLNGSAFDRIEQTLKAPVDRSFPDQTLKRSQAIPSIPASVQELYERLCTLACYSEENGARQN